MSHVSSGKARRSGLDQKIGLEVETIGPGRSRLAQFLQTQLGGSVVEKRVSVDDAAKLTLEKNVLCVGRFKKRRLGSLVERTQWSLSRNEALSGPFSAEFSVANGGAASADHGPVLFSSREVMIEQLNTGCDGRKVELSVTKATLDFVPLSTKGSPESSEARELSSLKARWKPRFVAIIKEHKFAGFSFTKEGFVKRFVDEYKSHDGSISFDGSYLVNSSIGNVLVVLDYHHFERFLPERFRINEIITEPLSFEELERFEQAFRKLKSAAGAKGMSNFLIPVGVHVNVGVAGLSAGDLRKLILAAYQDHDHIAQKFPIHSSRRVYTKREQDAFVRKLLTMEGEVTKEGLARAYVSGVRGLLPGNAQDRISEPKGVAFNVSHVLAGRREAVELRYFDTNPEFSNLPDIIDFSVGFFEMVLSEPPRAG